MGLLESLRKFYKETSAPAGSRSLDHQELEYATYIAGYVAGQNSIVSLKTEKEKALLIIETIVAAGNMKELMPENLRSSVDGGFEE